MSTSVLLLCLLVSTTSMHMSMSVTEDLTEEVETQWLQNGVRTFRECLVFFECGTLGCMMGCSADGYEGDISTYDTSSTDDSNGQRYSWRIHFGATLPLGLALVSTCEDFCGRSADRQFHKGYFQDADGDGILSPKLSFLSHWWYFSTDGVDFYGTDHTTITATTTADWYEINLSRSPFEEDSLEAGNCLDACKARGVLDVDDDVLCSAGFDGDGVVAASATWPYVTQGCTAVDCPAGTAGDSVADGCACQDGLAGEILATSVSPYYSGSCDAVDCPINSAGDSVADGCVCDDGYTGEILATSVSPYYSGSCEEDYSNSAVLPMVSSLIWLCVLMLL